MLYVNRRQEVKDRQTAKTTDPHKQTSAMCIELEATSTVLKTVLPFVG